MKRTIQRLKHPAIDHAMGNMIYRYGVFSTTIKQVNPIGVWVTSLPSKTGVSPKYNVWAPNIFTEFRRSACWSLTVLPVVLLAVPSLFGILVRSSRYVLQVLKLIGSQSEIRNYLSTKTVVLS
jgi:hypothetical protein